MKLKKIVALCLALAMVFCLAACGGGSSSDKTLNIKIWDTNQQDGIQEIANDWAKSYDDGSWKVDVQVVDWDQYWTLLESGAEGGDMPDVFWMHSNTAQMYTEGGQLLDLTDYVAADDSIQLDGDHYYQGIIDLYTADGKTYALPKDHDTIALLYNKTLFDKYNVEYPTDDWTWDDMYEAAKKITDAGKADGIYGYACNTSNNQDGWYNIIYDYGAQVINDTHDGTTIGSTNGKAAMEQFRKLLTVATDQTTVSENGTDTLFKSGKVAMISQGSWMIKTFYDTMTSEECTDEYAWALLPYADTNNNGKCDSGERYSAYNGLGWAAYAGIADDKKDAAYSLISYFCGETGQTKQAELGVTMGGMIGVSEAFSNAFDGMDVSAFLKAEDYDLFFRPYTKNTTTWEDAIQKEGAFLDAWNNPTDASAMATACENAQKIIEDAIAAEQA